ncbi:MAG: DUF4097 family beta strand repeat-containing protein [Planctomycetota bacterium]
MSRLSPLGLLAASALGIAAACTGPQFQAERQRELRESAAGVSTLVCTTHNGAIEVLGTDALDIAVRVRMTAWGHTQDEAEAAANQLEVAVERGQDGALRLSGIEPADLGFDRSASFDFTVELPAALALQLRTHNGAIRVQGGRGALHAVSHNGRLEVRTAAPTLELESHNGRIEVTLDGAGPVDGSVRSHNGRVEVAMGDRSARVAASTHNGRISIDRGPADAEVTSDPDQSYGDPTGNAVAVTIGDAGGRLDIGTHNGRVTVR